ncbi:hypothetical protein WMR29_001186 [Enterobacter hormaechei subsp. hoffmannii]
MSTITNKFTKEQLQQIEAAAKEVMWPVVWSEKKAREHFSEKITPKVVLKLARIALASLEAESKPKQPELSHVIYHFRDWNEGFPVERFKADYVISWMLANYPPAQPTAVSVPGDVSGPLAHAYKELTPTFMRNHIDVFERYGIYPDGSAGIQAMRIALDGMNRRAAMLQGADGSSPVIPDGWVMVPVEPTKEMINSAMRDNETGEVAEIYELMVAATPQRDGK